MAELPKNGTRKLVLLTGVYFNESDFSFCLIPVTYTFLNKVIFTEICVYKVNNT